MMFGVALLLLIQPGQPGKPAAAPQPEAPKQATGLVAFPSPLITEILYAVPSKDGDANKDGTRDVNGDEFIELVNPHDKPIQLGGYILADRDLKKGDHSFTSMHFKFPVMELKPGEVVVVFNGHKQKWTGPVGDAAKAPAKGNEHFAGARVLTMGITSDKQGLANKGDWVQLIAPDGKVVERIYWGDAKPEGTGDSEEAPLVSGKSIERRTKTAAFEPCSTGTFSPGTWPPGTPVSPNQDDKKPEDKKPEVK
jgi:hypothetical protein